MINIFQEAFASLLGDRERKVGDQEMRKWIFGALALAGLSISMPACAASKFYFNFDNQGLVDGNGPIVPPIVGYGNFRSPVDLAAGTYNLSDLGGYSMFFRLQNGSWFNSADIATPLAGVAIRITDIAGGLQRLFFTESGKPGSTGGPHYGALDLIHGANFLTFEPDFHGGNYLYMASGGYKGRYVALSASSVPEPASWALMIAGFGLVGATLRGRQRQQASVGYAV